jgi:hypothetical protein
LTLTPWHYTTGQKLALILESGAIVPATALVPRRERPVVWFSLNQRWEKTANKAIVHDGSLISLTMQQTAELCNGLARFGVAPDTAPYNWPELKRLSRMSSKMVRSLYDSALRQGASPSEWRGTFDPVPREKWTSVEVFTNGVWIPVSR